MQTQPWENRNEEKGFSYFYLFTSVLHTKYKSQGHQCNPETPGWSHLGLVGRKALIAFSAAASLHCVGHHCQCCCTPFSDLCHGQDWPPHCQMLRALPSAELPIHSSCLHCNSLLKERLVQCAYRKCGWKKLYLPSGNWFEFSRLFSTLYVNPLFRSLNSTSENRKCGKSTSSETEGILNWILEEKTW